MSLTDILSIFSRKKQHQATTTACHDGTVQQSDGHYRYSSQSNGNGKNHVALCLDKYASQTHCSTRKQDPNNPNRYFCLKPSS